jgi:hypothetical protein
MLSFFWVDRCLFAKQFVFCLLRRFFLTQYTKTGKNIPTDHNITKWPQNVSNGLKIFQMTIKYSTNDYKYTNVFHHKAHQNLPKFGFLVWKYTIWQPWDSMEVKHCLLNTRVPWRRGVRSRHRHRQWNRRWWVRISPGFKGFRTGYIHCNGVLCNLIRFVIVRIWVKNVKKIYLKLIKTTPEPLINFTPRWIMSANQISPNRISGAE